MRFPKSKNLKWLSIPIVAAVVAAMVVALLPGGVSVKADRGVLSIGVRTAYAQNPEPRPAYQVSIPHGVGSETGLKAFPPKLEVIGKDNWLAVQSPDGLDVPVGTYTYDAEGDAISVDRYSGKIYVDSSTNNLIITAGALSEKAKYDIEVATYTLHGGETVYNEEKQKSVVTELRAKFRSYIYGSGSDLYLLENTPQNQEVAKKEIKAVRVYAYVKAQLGAGTPTAETRIGIGSKKYNGITVALASAEQRIGTTYTTNPATGVAWTWQDIDNLQAGVTLKSGELSYVYVEVEMAIHSQTFFPITPVEVTPATASAWTDVDVSAYVPAGATGVILHLVNTYAAAYAIGLRKNGSTDSRIADIFGPSHSWAAIGVDASRIFEAYVGNITNIDIYLVGYTVSGVTFFTNAYDKSLTTTGAWTDIDSATEAPSAIGLIWEILGGAEHYLFGLQKKGSTDNRTATTVYHRTFGAIIGSDTSQIVEGYINNTAVDFFLVGYITDGATFNTNATNVSLSTTATWLDLAALPANSVMGFIEVTTSPGYNYGLRKNGSTEDIYYGASRHPWAFVECDAGGIIEGKIANVAVDFFVVGYATGAVAAPAITVSPATYNFGVVIESSTPSTTTSYFTITNTSTMITNNTIGVTTSTWSGGVTWAHSETATAGSNQAGLLSNKGGTWGTGDVIVKYTSPNTIAANQAANTNWDFGLKLIAPTAFTDGVQKQIIVKITASAS